MFFCAGVFAAVCDDYRSSGAGVSVSRISIATGIAVPVVEKWVKWLEKRRVVFSSTSNLGACFYPTHYGLSLENDPKTFLEKILFFRFAKECFADDSDSPFLNRIEGMLRSAVKE
jgi:hypothetical protein